jgi:hypothetical protein
MAARTIERVTGPMRLVMGGALGVLVACGHAADGPGATQQVATFKGYPELEPKAPTAPTAPAVPTPPAVPTSPADVSGTVAAPGVQVTAAPAAPAVSGPSRAATDDARPGDRFWPPRSNMAGPVATASQAGQAPGASVAPAYVAPAYGAPAYVPPVAAASQAPEAPTAAAVSYRVAPARAPAPAPSPPAMPAERRPYDRPLPLAQGFPAEGRPSPGRRYMVRGVDKSDVLNVRAAPGSQSPVVGRIPPDTRGVLVTGARRSVGPGVWREIRYGDVQGWVNERFLMEETAE